MVQSRGVAATLTVSDRSIDARALALGGRISRDAAIKWGAIAAVALADVVLCARQGLYFAPQNLLLPALYLVLLGLPALYYVRRGETRFVLCLATLAQTIAFISAFTVLMYAVAMIGRPLCDGKLAAFDAWWGVHVPTIREWTQAHPSVRWLMDSAYGTLLFQLPLIIVLLGLLGDRRCLEKFVLQDIVAALITVAAFAAFPADGPFSFYGFPASPDQTHYLDHFQGLRSGELRSVTLQEAAGLVTFPSFHTAEAVLMALAFRKRRGLFLVFGSLNALVALSTMTTGWHYFADVVSGIIVAALSFAIVQAAAPWVYGADVKSGRSLESLDGGQLVGHG